MNRNLISFAVALCVTASPAFADRQWTEIGRAPYVKGAEEIIFYVDPTSAVQRNGLRMAWFRHFHFMPDKAGKTGHWREDLSYIAADCNRRTIANLQFVQYQIGGKLKSSTEIPDSAALSALAAVVPGTIGELKLDVICSLNASPDPIEEQRRIESDRMAEQVEQARREYEAADAQARSTQEQMAGAAMLGLLTPTQAPYSPPPTYKSPPPSPPETRGPITYNRIGNTITITETNGRMHNCIPNGTITNCN